ncbi:MAG TPA: thioredoxin family protein [Thermoanaerobaculia bacterium]|nr:thioredoxin family protein [Thermoanaerobaculia bacterium]
MKRLLAPILATLLALVAAPALATGWSSDPEAAFARAEREDRLVLVALYADWCGWCRKLEREVFPSDRFRDFARPFVLLRANVEDGGAGGELRDRHRAGSLPTLLVLDARQVRIAEVEGYLPAGDLVAEIERGLAAWRSLLTAFEQALAAPPRPERLQSLAEQLHRRDDGRRAAALYRRWLALDPPEPARRWGRYLLADALRLDGDRVAALAEAGRARDAATAASDGELAELAALLASRIHEADGRCAEARAALEAFLADHPANRRSARVRGEIARLAPDGPASRCG